MKTISVNVSDGVYQGLQDIAKQTGRKPEDLVLAAVENLKSSSDQTPGPHASALTLSPLDLGRMLCPLNGDNDLLGEMLDGDRH